MGSPPAPTAEQYAQLEVASQLQQLSSPIALFVHEGQPTLTFDLPRQAVSLLVLEW